MKNTVSLPELLIYFLIWLSANLYCLYKLFTAQNDVYQNDYSILYSLGDIRKGWGFISRLQDVSDIEWNSCKFFLKTAWFYLLLQFLVSELIRKSRSTLVKHWYIISSVTFIVMYMGFKQLFIILIQPTIFCLLIFSGGKKLSIWLTSVLLLTFYNSIKYKDYLWYYLDHDDIQDEEVYLLLFTVAWSKLRCISFCIDYVDRNNEGKGYTSKLETVINMFSYVMYTPLLYVGPIILYEDFEKSFCCNTQTLTIRLKRFIWDMFLFTTYALLLDLAFHYIYFLAMLSDVETIRKLPAIALCGGGLWMGLEFYVKYVVSYGITTAFARLDNFNPPPTPRCIARVHIYSQMWRYFDVGLYRYLVKYIYKPALNMMSTHFKLSKVLNKLLSSLLTFIYIFMWHGTLWSIFIWSILNYLGVTLEQLGKIISVSNYYKMFKTTILKSDAMETRFVALLCTPLLALSAISNFYLFAGSKVGNIYFECFTHPSFFNSMLVIISLYCCCHVSMALVDVPSRTDKNGHICPYVKNKAVSNSN